MPQILDAYICLTSMVQRYEIFLIYANFETIIFSLIQSFFMHEGYSSYNLFTPDIFTFVYKLHFIKEFIIILYIL